MTQPKTYNGKFNRVKAMIEESHNVRFAVEAFAKANPDQDVFYRLNRLVYLEIKETLKQQGKSDKSSSHMAFTLTGWLQTELFPKTRVGGLMNDTKYFQAMRSGVSVLDYFKELEKDPHQSIRHEEGDICEKLGLDLRSTEERQMAVLDDLYKPKIAEPFINAVLTYFFHHRAHRENTGIFSFSMSPPCSLCALWFKKILKRKVKRRNAIFFRYPVLDTGPIGFLTKQL